MPALRARSVALTGYLEQRLAPLGRLGVEVITPREPAGRGAQLSLRFGSASAADAVLAGLAAAASSPTSAPPTSSASRRCRCTTPTTRPGACAEVLAQAPVASGSSAG